MVKISDKVAYRAGWAIIIFAPIIVALQLYQRAQTIEGVAFYAMTATLAWKFLKDLKRKRQEKEAPSATSAPPQS
jgi:hypothetical protein